MFKNEKDILQEMFKINENDNDPNFINYHKYFLDFYNDNVNEKEKLILEYKIIKSLLYYNNHLLQHIKKERDVMNKNQSNNIIVDLLNYYCTPGKLYKLITFFVSNNYSLKDYKLEDLLRLIIKENLYKKYRWQNA